jgi:hypothetical protein
MTDIMTALNHSDTRDACRLTEAALTIAALGDMFSVAAVSSAARYLREQARFEQEPDIKKVLEDIASYFEKNQIEGRRS